MARPASWCRSATPGSLPIVLPTSCWHRGLHGCATETDQVDRRAKIQAPGRNEGGILAQAVPRHRGGQRTALAPPHSPGRDARRQHGRLRLLGDTQRFLRSLLAELPQVIAEDGRCLRERVSYHRFGCSQAGEHAHRLRTLAREHECECRHRCSFSSRAARHPRRSRHRHLRASAYGRVGSGPCAPPHRAPAESMPPRCCRARAR